MQKRPYSFIFILTGGITLLVFLAYFTQFKGMALSKNNSDWGDFGSYIGGTLGIILTTANLIFLYYTFREQQNLNAQQQFENTFFNLLANHKQLVEESFDSKREIDYQIEKAQIDEISGYQLLDYYREIEETKLNEYFKLLDTSNSISVRNKYSLNHKALDNSYVSSKDYLVSITNNIVDIYLYIKETTAITQSLREFYINTFLRSLRRSEKFFLMLLYIQQRSPIAEKKGLTKSDVELICDPKNQFSKFLSINTFGEIPFCIIGLIKDENKFMPMDFFHHHIEDFPQSTKYYKITTLTDGIELQEITFSCKWNERNYSKIYSGDECGSGYYIDLYVVWTEMLRDCHKEANGCIPSDTLLSSIVSDLTSRNSNFEFRVYIKLNFKGKVYAISDNIKYEFGGSHPNIKCERTLSLPEKVTIKNFGSKKHYIEA